MNLERDECPQCWWRLAALAVFGLVFIGAITLFGVSAADGATAPCLTQMPPLAGIPPWAFHADNPLTGDSGSYARAYGQISLGHGQISGTISQADLTPGKPQFLAVVRLVAVVRPVSLLVQEHEHAYRGTQVNAQVPPL